MRVLPLQLVGAATALGVGVAPHRRQFVLGPEAFHAHDDWTARELARGLWLSHCPTLPVGSAVDTRRRRWTLLGRAVETRAERSDPLAAITAVPSEEVPRLFEGWAGRWALTGEGALHVDATGLLGCLYGRAPEGRTWASSSPALIARIVHPREPLPLDPRRLAYEQGISWYTPPRSGIHGVRRVLPSQVLDLGSGEVRARRLMPPIEPGRDLEEALSLLESILVTTVRRLGQLEPRPLLLGLTAGFDSRLMLAAARRARVELRTFTRIARRTPPGDRIVPPRLARRLGYPHTFLRGRRPGPERRRLLVEHALDRVSEGDAQPFLEGVRDPLEGIAFGGHGFALASGFLHQKTVPAGADDPAAAVAASFGETAGSTAVAGLREWLDWAAQTPHERLDWRDRFFIEQRQAGWLSAKEQVYDLGPPERFPTLNAARTHALLLGVAEERRRDSRIQEELIRRLAPELLEYPFNPSPKELGRVRSVLVKSRDDPLYASRTAVRRLRRAIGSGRP